MNQLRLTPIVLRLLIINAAVFLIFAIGLVPGWIYDQYFTLYKWDLLHYAPDRIRDASRELFHPIQLLTHFFSHSLSGITHILFNSLALIFFGPMLEDTVGGKRFLRFYLFCGLVGGIIVTLFDPSFNPVVGASGALFGVLTAFAFYYPNQKVSFLFIPISFTAKQMVIGLTVISGIFVVLDVLNIDAGGGNISHFGHLSGVAAAALYFQIERYLPFKD